MSTRVDLAEFLTAYLAEADEQLTLANAQVLAIEAANRNLENNPRAVRDLFRALHTIKGLSAMVGVEPIVAIAHRMETALRVADRSGSLAEPSLEPLVDGLRAIDVRLRALRDGKPVAEPPTALLESLDALEADGLHGAETRSPTLDLDPTLGDKLAAFEVEQLVKALLEGRRAIRLEFVPSKERAAAGRSINSVREALGAVAEIVKVLPVAVPAGPEAPVGLVFVLLLVSSESNEALARVAGVDPSAVHAFSLSQGAPASPTTEIAVMSPYGDTARPDEEPERRSVLRVDVARVDDAMEKLSSLIVSRSRLLLAVSTLSAASVDTREIKQITTEIGRQLRDLRSSILQVRMVRVSETLDRIPLVVRGLRRTTGKKVRLEMDVGDAELDKAVAERIFPAILHLVRNAVDHGLESEAERAAAGKPEEGLIQITTSSRSNTQLEILVRDDGRGIDRARVAARASADLPTSDATLLDLLCRPGLSTRDEVTTTSGRGMGMDIVKRIVVDQLGGEILLSSQPGLGAAFSLRVPLTIAIVDAFTILCGAERFVVPVSLVEEIVEIDLARIVSAPVTLPGGATQIGMFERRGEAVPLVDLASLLRIPRAGLESAKKGLIVRRAGEPIAFVLDRVLGQQETVVRPLVDPLVNVPGVSGSTDLGDGRPTLVLDLVALAAARPTRALRSRPELPALPGGTAEERHP